MKRPTINDVAKLAGVSKTTVSHFLNKRFYNMREDTRERISKAIEDLNYNPNFVAKSMTSKKTMTIGIIVSNILHSFSTQIIRAVEDYAHNKGYQAIVCNADDNPLKEKEYVNMLLAKQVDGIIAIPTTENIELYDGLDKKGYPIIFIDRYIDSIDIPSFLLDNNLAIKTAFDYFLQNNFNSIGFISQELIDITPRQERHDAYQSLCHENGITPFIISGTLQNIRVSIRNAINDNTLPEAIIVANDLALLEVLREIKQQNLSIPDDLSLISIDDIEFTEFFNPGLTVIAQPTFDIGRGAAKAMFDKINNNINTDCINRFNPILIERSSVKNV